jgi:hypothetical protein
MSSRFSHVRYEARQFHGFFSRILYLPYTMGAIGTGATFGERDYQVSGVPEPRFPAELLSYR